MTLVPSSRSRGQSEDTAVQVQKPAAAGAVSNRQIVQERHVPNAGAIVGSGMGVQQGQVVAAADPALITKAFQTQDNMMKEMKSIFETQTTMLTQMFKSMENVVVTAAGVKTDATVHVEAVANRAAEVAVEKALKSQSGGETKAKAEENKRGVMPMEMEAAGSKAAGNATRQGPKSEGSASTQNHSSKKKGGSKCAIV